jgi:hypothetical protein
MAFLYITEFSNPGYVNGVIPTGMEPGTDQTPVAISGSSAQSAALKNNTQLVRLETDSICSVTFGTNPTATANNRRLAANQTEYFSVPLSSSFKVAVITNS